MLTYTIFIAIIILINRSFAVIDRIKKLRHNYIYEFCMEPNVIYISEDLFIELYKNLEFFQANMTLDISKPNIYTIHGLDVCIISNKRDFISMGVVT